MIIFHQQFLKTTVDNKTFSFSSRTLSCKASPYSVAKEVEVLSAPSINFFNSLISVLNNTFRLEENTLGTLVENGITIKPNAVPEEIRNTEVVSKLFNVPTVFNFVDETL